jgi:hypothetical protein
MFYEVDLPEGTPQAKKAAALVVLNPSESRRLLAKATVALPEVQRAFKEGMIIIARGITNAYVTEELLGIRVEPKAGLTAGMVCRGITNANSGPPATTHHVIRQGRVVEGADSRQEILDFGPDDVFIKGANAIDPEGNAGIFVSSPVGGTIGMAWPVVTPRGAHLIMPVGLEKLVPSVVEAAKRTGIYHYKWTMGLPVRLVPVVLGSVLTEVQALAVLAGVQATHVGSGGVGGSEGAVVLSIEGEESRVERAFELVKSIKGEPPVMLPETLCITSAEEHGYDPMAQLSKLTGAAGLRGLLNRP